MSYLYDGDGQRVEKCTEGTPGKCASGATGTLYWMGSGAVDAETDLSGNVVANYVYVGGARIAKRDASKAVHFYYSDHLGSTSLITDANGDMSPQAESDYFPYGGEIVITADSTSNHYKYTGKERDSESGLDNFGARYDSSALGRFMTPDWAAKPITVPYAKFGDPQTLNLYAYVENAPVNNADADGHTDPNSFRMGDCDQHNGDQQCTTDQNDRNAGKANQQDEAKAQQNAAQAQQQNTPQDQDLRRPNCICGVPAPTNADGSAAKPPVPPPPGKDGKPNDWVRVPGTKGRPDKWVPRDRVPSPKGGQPGASWDADGGHWDIDDGQGKRTRYLPDGTKVDHNNKPIPMSTVGKAAAGAAAGAIIVRGAVAVGRALAACMESGLCEAIP